MLSIENFNRLVASSGNDQNPLINAMIILFGVPFLLTILRKAYAFLSGGSRRQSQYNALVKKLLCDEEKKISQSLLDDKNKNNKSSGDSSTDSSSSSFTSISDALHGQRDESVREFCRLLTYRLVEQAANGRSDYEFHFRPYDLWFEFKEVGAGLFTIFNIRSYWNCVDSQGSRDVIKEILEGRDGATRAVSNKVASAGDEMKDDDDDDDEHQEKQPSSASAQYSSPYYYSSLHQASVRNHYKKHEEESKKHSSQNGLRVDWSVASNYGSNPFAPKWILSCKWDRPELTRAREFGGR